jgi:hypothetical protein
MVFGLLGAAMALVAVLIGLKLFFGDDTPPLTENAFDTALQKWQAEGPTNYDLDVEIGGAQPGVVHVEVRDGKVINATRDGRPLDERNFDVWSIAGQFEELEREFEFAENPQREMQAPPGARVWLSCEFDPNYGYPLRFYRHATGGAPEVYWTNKLTPKNPPSSSGRGSGCGN